MPDWQTTYRDRRKTANEALAAVNSGERVYVHMGAAAPQALLAALCEHAPRLRGVEVLHCITIGPAPYTAERYASSFRHNALFVSGNTRAAVQAGRADFIPVFLHEIEQLFLSGAIPLDHALIQCAPPDRHGFLSLGPGVDISLTAARQARRLIVQVNPAMPRTCGNSMIHVGEADVIVEAEEALPEFLQGEITGVHQAIGRHVAALVPDRATLQVGVGGIPEAVLAELRGHKDLGVHTEMFSDGLIPLIESGVVTNAAKTLHPHKAVTSFVLGTRAVYDYIHGNPFFEFLPSSYTNDPFVIAQNERMVAVNAALEVDLSGQVCSDSIGSIPYSGIGGQVDFIRGAARARHGVPVIALPATASEGKLSRIVPFLKPGAGVVTSRGNPQTAVDQASAAHAVRAECRTRAAAMASNPFFMAGSAASSSSMPPSCLPM